MLKMWLFRIYYNRNTILGMEKNHFMHEILKCIIKMMSLLVYMYKNSINYNTNANHDLLEYMQQNNINLL